MNKLKRFSLFQYALLAMPLAFAGLPIYIHAPDFYAVHLNVSLAIIGLTLVALRFIDAFQDPFIGMLSDKYNHHRSKIMILGMAMLTFGFTALFNPIEPSENQYLILLWMASSIFICTTGYSIVTINMQALGGLWKGQIKEMPRIMTWREGAGLIGLLIGSILPTILLLYYPPMQSYSILSFLFLPIIIISGAVFLKWLKKTKFDTLSKSASISFKDILRDKPVRYIYGIALLSATASAIPATLVLFYIRDYLQAENFTGLFLMLYFLSGVLAMPLWQYIAGKKSSIFAWIISTILACLVFIGAFFLNAGDIVAFGIICIVSGMAVGGDLALPPTIIAEFIKRNAHQNAASQYYALGALITKSALAIATGIGLPLLAFYGYQPGTATNGIELPLAYAAIPCVLKLISALLLWRFMRRYQSILNS